MPSGGQTPIEFEVAEKVSKIAKEAYRHGLQTEWFSFFIGGIKEGQHPVEAANLAAIEWDF